MNRERHRYWASYIRDCKSRLLLAHWKIELSREPSDAVAEVNNRAGGHEARIWLDARFDSYTRTKQREYIVHELLHLHFAPLAYHLGMQGGERDDVRACILAHHSHEEYAVDDLARIIAPHMPLPPKV